jgi:RHS repeat-associated protein
VAWGTGTVTLKYEHTDALGSPVAETDATGVAVKRNSYAPYGEAYAPTVIDGTGYTGHVMDQATGLTYMQQRYYDPQIGRFLSVDPMGVDTSKAFNFNRYDYAADNPYKFTDPDGRAAVVDEMKTMLGRRPLPAPDKSAIENSGRQQIADANQRSNHNAVESVKADIKAIPGKIADVGVCAFKAVVGGSPEEIAGNAAETTVTSALEHSGETLGVKEISEVSKLLGFAVKLAPLFEARSTFVSATEFATCSADVLLPIPGSENRK